MPYLSSTKRTCGFISSFRFSEIPGLKNTVCLLKSNKSSNKREIDKLEKPPSLAPLVWIPGGASDKSLTALSLNELLLTATRSIRPLQRVLSLRVVQQPGCAPSKLDSKIFVFDQHPKYLNNQSIICNLSGCSTRFVKCKNNLLAPILITFWQMLHSAVSSPGMAVKCCQAIDLLTKIIFTWSRAVETSNQPFSRNSHRGFFSKI